MISATVRYCTLLLSLLSLSLIPLCSADSLKIEPDTPLNLIKAAAKDALARHANAEALTYFDAAVSRDPSDSSSFYQRGITYLSLGRSLQAAADFNKVLSLKPDFEPALTQRAKLRARNGEWASAREDFLAVGAKAEEDLARLNEAEGAYYIAMEAEKHGDFEACINQAGIAIMTAGAALSLRQLRARCRFERGEIQEGVSDLAHVLQIHPGSIEPHIQISAMLFYGLGDTDRGLAQIKKCLHSDPDSKPCKSLFREEKIVAKQVDKLNAHISKAQYSAASKLLVGAATEDEPGLLSDVKTNVGSLLESGAIHPRAPSGLYLDLVEKACQCYSSMKSSSKAQKYCSEALTLNPDSLYGLLHKAQTHSDAENFEAAIQTLTAARDKHPDQQGVIEEKLNQAQIALKRSKTKDYYKVLGVPRDADERTIKKAYRDAVKAHHPDKSRAKGIPKEDAEKKMASINEAYEVLSDPELKARFDQGEDPNDPMSQQGGNHFQGSNFGGGQQFVFQQGGGRAFKFSGGFAGFPGFG
ncbi:hypothetical protein PV10_00615 [Exophiala mesophila]|uniref:Tetratricopeptide repeat and J domain-containing co-chaperone DNJ1 n=1 Tax=Exophiala mesophila TaxID=212818 RepID=A0A0D2ACY2_EXOME|nr:uncharacterized protein PV10_00615 [Exophiala mesophila]KIV96798.1 hypothetical protein PV10_00615 [Exophiala mesophila]